MPRGTSGSAANSPTDSSSDPSRRLNGGLRRSDGRADLERVGEVRRRGQQRLGARLQLAEQRRRVGQERPLQRELLDRRVERRRPLGDRLLDERRATLRSAPNVASRLTNSCACASAAGATIAAVRGERADEARQVGLGAGEVARDRDDVAQQRAERADRLVDARAAAGERVAEPVQVRRARPRGCRRRTCSRTRRTRPARAWRCASGIVAPSSKPSSDVPRVICDVLEAERGARPDDQRRVHRQRVDRALELEREQRDVRARRPAARRRSGRPSRRACRRSAPRCRARGWPRSAARR